MGITGLTAAYLAVEAGASVAVIERGRIAMGESAQTTAHLVEGVDADYRELVQRSRHRGARAARGLTRRAAQARGRGGDGSWSDPRGRSIAIGW